MCKTNSFYQSYQSVGRGLGWGRSSSLSVAAAFSPLRRACQGSEGRVPLTGAPQWGTLPRRTGSKDGRPHPRPKGGAVSPSRGSDQKAVALTYQKKALTDSPFNALGIGVEITTLSGLERVKEKSMEQRGIAFFLYSLLAAQSSDWNGKPGPKATPKRT